MINAKEALAQYDIQKRLAEIFLNEVVEPKIKEVMKDAKSIEIEGIDEWYVGKSFIFLEEIYKDKVESNQMPRTGANIALTETVKRMLREFGYTVSEGKSTGSNEYKSGCFKYTISWDDSDKGDE